MQLFLWSSFDGNNKPIDSKRGEKNGGSQGGRDSNSLLGSAADDELRSWGTHPAPPDAAVYVCWYSQLRDLIDRNRRLARHLGVCALPNGGFRGDWFAGVAKGSVSQALGREILGTLCNQKENYKRFAEGVGIPSQTGFYDDRQRVPAWPGAKVSASGSDLAGRTLREVGAIHSMAASRSHIDGYAKFRSALSAICGQLTPLSGLCPTDPLTRKDITGILRGIPKRVELLLRGE